MNERLTDEQLHNIDSYLAGAERARLDPRVAGWLELLVAEVRAQRGGGLATAEAAPQKRHGDALLDGSGTRHGGLA